MRPSVFYPPMDEARRALARLFLRNGVIREPDRLRRAKEKSTYKKGYEVRLVAFTREELGQIRGFLHRAGFPLAKPFAKSRRFVQPVYGRQAVETFRALAREIDR